ncbi:MAG: hypothetical protein KatS3mg087_2172 [Patescibacteria group bacterium]|nr:MAG: hypothetical protein KatS3mg087_2172 [Patescibacteria group bacterium]
MVTIRYQHNFREKPQQVGGRAGNRPIGSLALRLQAEMVAYLLEGYLYRRPATNEPGENRQCRHVFIRAQKLHRSKFFERITHQHPQDWLDGLIAVTLEGAAGSHLERVGPLAIPVRDEEPLLGRILALEYGLIQALASFMRALWLARRAWGRRLGQRRLEALSGDDCDATILGINQIEHGKAGGGSMIAYADYDEIAIRQRTRQPEHHLQGPIGKLHVPAPVFFVIALPRSEHRQRRQRPHMSAPGDLGQIHQREASETPGLKEVPGGRAHRIAVNAPGLDVGSTPMLNRIIDPEDEGAVFSKGAHPQRQQHGCRELGRPSGAIQDAMIVLEGRDLSEPHNTQYTGDGASAQCQERSAGEHLNVPKEGLGEQGLKAYHMSSKLGWHRRQWSSLLVRK